AHKRRSSCERDSRRQRHPPRGDHSNIGRVLVHASSPPFAIAPPRDARRTRWSSYYPRKPPWRPFRVHRALGVPARTIAHGNLSQCRCPSEIGGLRKSTGDPTRTLG